MESVERANHILSAMERAQPYTPESIKLVRAEIERLRLVTQPESTPLKPPTSASTKLVAFY